MNKLRDWFNKTPTVDGPTKEELRKANARITKTVYGGSHVERPPRTDIPKTPKYGVSDAHKKRIKKGLNNA